MNVSEIKPGMTLLLNNEIYQVVSCEHAKLARGSAFLRTKLKNLNNGKVIENTLRNSDNINPAYIEKKKLQFLYKEDPFYHFMDMETYEDFALNKDKIEGVSIWLKENLELEGLFYDNRLIALEMPSFLTMEVAQTEPGIRGDTVKQGTKPAKLETGVNIQVPLFIDSGDKIKVNPQTQEYLGRA